MCLRLLGDFSTPIRVPLIVVPDNKRPFPPGKNQHESGPSRPPPQNLQKNWENFPVDKDQCLKCKGRGHYKRDCPEFLKELLRKGEDTITFVDESLYLSYDKSTWWIDLFMLLILYRDQV